VKLHRQEMLPKNVRFIHKKTIYVKYTVYNGALVRCFVAVG